MQTYSIPGAGVVLLVLGAPAVAYDVNEHLSIGGVIAVSGQCQKLSNKAGADNECDYAVPAQP
ncbi:MAG: hypothetical protein PVJ15_07225, partial [Gammaproteobacteria bacterium]